MPGGEGVQLQAGKVSVTLTEVVGRPDLKLGTAVSPEATNYLWFRNEGRGGGSARISLEVVLYLCIKAER